MAQEQRLQEAMAAYPAYYTDSLLPAVRHGDLVVRMGTDLTSVLLAGTNPTDKRFSHAGILFVEQDTPWVYHALGGQLYAEGGVSREPLYVFAHPDHTRQLGVYRLDPQPPHLAAVQQQARQFWLRHIPFDGSFSLASKDSLYCTELVALCYESQGWPYAHFATIQVDNLTYLPVQSLTGHAHMKPVLSKDYGK